DLWLWNSFPIKPGIKSRSSSIAGHNALQKLQQTILKLVRCPRSLAATLTAVPSMSLFPKAPFDLSVCPSMSLASPQLRSHILLQNSQIIPNHDDFVEEPQLVALVAGLAGPGARS